MTEDDTKVIAYIRRQIGRKKVSKVSTFKAGSTFITVYDYGMESNGERYYVEAKTDYTIETSIHAYRDLQTALGFISWEKL